MNWAKVARIIRREYVESVRKKSFLFGLVATPLLMLTMIFLPLLLGDVLVDENLTLAVLDHTREYGTLLEESLREEGEGLEFRANVMVYTPENAPQPEELDSRVSEGVLSGWILLPADFEETSTLEYHAGSVTNVTALSAIENRFDRLLAS